VTPEAARYLQKARQCLSNARANLRIGLSNDAGRNAFFAAFHAAQAFIFNRAGKAAKTHQGVQSEFTQLAKDEKMNRTSTRVFRPFYHKLTT